MDQETKISPLPSSPFSLSLTHPKLYSLLLPSPEVDYISLTAQPDGSQESGGVDIYASTKLPLDQDIFEWKANCLGKNKIVLKLPKVEAQTIYVLFVPQQEQNQVLVIPKFYSQSKIHQIPKTGSCQIDAETGVHFFQSQYQSSFDFLLLQVHLKRNMTLQKPAILSISKNSLFPEPQEADLTFSIPYKQVAKEEEGEEPLNALAIDPITYKAKYTGYQEAKQSSENKWNLVTSSRSLATLLNPSKQLNLSLRVTEATEVEVRMKGEIEVKYLEIKMSELGPAYLKDAYDKFNQIYRKIDELRESEYTASGKKEEVYGEIEFLHFYAILQRAEIHKAKTFWDLGCGTGKPMVLASLCFPHLEKIIGVELIGQLVEYGKKAISELGESKVEIYEGDLLEHDWSEADVVYVASLCFQDDLLTKLFKKAAQMKQGARFISLAEHPSYLESNAQIQEALKERGPPLNAKMSWGWAWVYVYERV